MPYEADTIARLNAYAREAIEAAGPAPLLTRDGERNAGCRHLAGSPSWLIASHWYDTDRRQGGYTFVGRDGVTRKAAYTSTHREAIARLEDALRAEGYVIP